MNVEQLERRLGSTDEIEITVTGRVSGEPVTRTVWFVQEGGRLYLLPVRGSDSEWFKNLLQTPVIRISADGAELTARARPITDPRQGTRRRREVPRQVRRRPGEKVLLEARRRGRGAAADGTAA